jgi:hypothetical protein
MNLLSKEVLTGAVALGAGAVAAKVVQKKVLPMVKLENPMLQNAATLALGILTPVAVKGAIGKGLGAGMIAVSVAGLVDPIFSKAGLTGTDTFMGDVLMGATEDSSKTFISANDFTAPSGDLTYGDAGEMDY